MSEKPKAADPDRGNPVPRRARQSSFPDLPAVCLSGISWDDLTQRPQHIMSRYSKFAPVLMVEPPRNPRYGIILNYVRPRTREVFPNIRSVSVVKPFPRDSSLRLLQSINDAFVRQMIDSLVTRLGFEDHLLWCYRYDSLSYGRTSKAKLVVYDCVDDWPAYLKSIPGVEAEENRLITASHVVFTTSQRLLETKRRLNPHTYLVPNGVDFEHFDVLSTRPGVPPELERVPHPIIGFSGAVYGWVDLNLVEAIAKRRPDWSFVFVGPVHDGIDKPDFPNVHFIGYIPYEILPNYVASFDVCILPFRHDQVTESANPIKMYEYMATGKPIVSTSIPEVEKFSGLIRIAEGADGFEKAIAAAIDNDSNNLVSARQSSARANSWNQRIETIMGIVRTRREELGV